VSFGSIMRSMARRLVPLVIVSLAISACSRTADKSETKVADETMDLKLNALNYTDVPIGVFYVDGTSGANVASRIGSGGGTIICCVSVPAKWHPGLTVTVVWRDDNMYMKDPKALASRVVPVEPYEYFSDGFLWVLFFPNDKIKVYASQWGPGAPDFPEKLQAPDEACPDHFTLLNSDPRCPKPDPRIKP
jgi:hypothetical protein